MSKSIQDGGVPESQMSEYDQVTTRMKERDEYLGRRLRRMRIVVRILSLGVGYVRNIFY